MNPEKFNNPLCFVRSVLLTSMMIVTTSGVHGQSSSLLHQPMAASPMAGSPMAANQSSAQQMQPNQYQENRLQATPQPPPSGSVSGQSYDGVTRNSPPTLSGVSWTYQPAPQMRRFQKHDIIAIRVDEITRVMAEGAADSRKRTLYEAILSDWIRLDKFSVKPAPQREGDPTVATESNNQYRAESSVESRESMSFNIAATIVDVRPNGNLVLEARKSIWVNDNLWETSLSGICRAQDIGPDNVVLSRDVIDLEIRKEDQGHMRDGYKRGWFSRWFDRVQPF